MRIKIRSTERNFNLWLPTRLFLNPVSAAICVKVVNNQKFMGSEAQSLLSINNENRELSHSAMCKLFRTVRKSRRLLQGQPLVSVNSADGEVVEIWI